MVKLVFLLGLLLIRLPTLLNRTEDPKLWGLALAPFWVVILYQIAVRPMRARHPIRLAFGLREAIPALAFVGLILASFPRAASAGAIEPLEALGHLFLWTTVGLFAVAVLLVRTSDGGAPVEGLQASVADALGIYVLTNVMLHLIGLESQKAVYAEPLYRPATILAAAGIQAGRVLFPMASGVASFGAVAGACLVASFLSFSQSDTPRHRAWMCISAVASVYALLLTDSRSAMFYSLLSVGALLLVPKLLGLISSYLPLLANLLPAILVGIAPLLSGSKQVELISRSSADLDTLNSRTYVWRAGLAEVRALKPGALFGYGYEGHYTSRISEQYAARFSSFIRPNVTGLHNALLQYALDIGLVGAGLYLVCFSLLMRVLAGMAAGVRGRSAVFGLAIFLLLAGATDAVPTPYSQELFMVFLLLLVSAVAVPQPVSALR